MRLKKFISIILSAAMTLSLFTVSVNAEGETETSQPITWDFEAFAKTQGSGTNDANITETMYDALPSLEFAVGTTKPNKWNRYSSIFGVGIYSDSGNYIKYTPSESGVVSLTAHFKKNDTSERWLSFDTEHPSAANKLFDLQAEKARGDVELINTRTVNVKANTDYYIHGLNVVLQSMTFEAKEIEEPEASDKPQVDEPANFPAAVSGYVSMSEGDFVLASSDKTPSIYVDENDYEGVIRAAGDLKNDIKSVSAVVPIDAVDAASADVVIGTVGKSTAIDTLVSAGDLDISKIEGKRESFTIQNVEGKLVIAGSDKRGTIYGIYDLSEKIGVSPWYYFADVKPGHADTLYINLPNGGYTEGEPSVEYRGIFLNDEFNMSEWSKSLGTTGQNMNNETYEKIFELLLRLKANYLWPAMHKYSTAFNVTEHNAELANKYGIVMGSSHCEPILRNNLGELYTYQQEWTAANPDKKLYVNTKDESNHNVSWMWTNTDGTNTVDNKEFLTDYWRARASANSAYENTYTLGMRGVHDGQFSTNMDKKTAMTEIIAAQRKILEEEVVKDGQTLSDVPQVFIPYKEMLDLYNGGLQIPNDVTLMWPDDNFGYIRQLPTDAERQRSGGAGIYYHLSYHGRPTSYLWLSSTQLGLIREEMTKAYDMGAQKIWVANVGDLKPAETEIEYFLDLARDVDSVRNTDTADWLSDNAKRDFGFDDTAAAEYADIKLGYSELANSRRPEHMSEGLFSLTDFGDEGQKTLDCWTELETRATALYETLDEAQKPSFYELLLYPIKGAGAMARKYINTDKAKQYEKNGWGSTVNKYAKLSDAAYDSVVSDTAAYTSMLGGKWNLMMNPYQRGLVGSFGGPISGKLTNPTVSTVPYTNMEIVSEGGSDLSFTKYSTEPKFIDIINTGSNSFDWKAETSADWVKLNKTSGTVSDNDRIYVSVDLSAASAVKLNATITFNRYIGNTIVDTKTVAVSMDNTEFTLDEKTYIESDGYVSIEAEHYTNSVKNGDYEWKVEKDFGRSGDSVKIYPNICQNISTPNTENSAYLEYQVYFTSSGSFPIDVYRMPTMNELSGATMRCRIGIDDSAPIQFNGTTKTGDGSNVNDPWTKGVLQNTEIISGTITVPSAGLHTIRLYNESAGFILDKFVITTGTKKASYFGASESYNTTYNNEFAPLPSASVAAEEQTGNIEELFSPKLIIKNVIPHYTSSGMPEGIAIDGDNMTVAILTGLEKDAQCYVAAYNSDGSLTEVKKSANTIVANSADRVFTFDSKVTKPMGGSIKAFVWTEEMEPVYKTLGMMSKGDISAISADIVKLENADSCNVVAASYDDRGNMINASYTEVDLSETAVNGAKSVQISAPTMEGAAEIQIMALDDLTNYVPIASAVTLDNSTVSLMASYEDGYAYPTAKLNDYIGREAVCAIEEQAPENGHYIRYIRQETVAENTFKKIPFNHNGQFKLNINVAGIDGIISEKLSTIINIQPDTAATGNTVIYSQDFSSDPSNDSHITLSGAAKYGNGAITMNSTAEIGSVTTSFNEPITMAQGEKITVVSKIAYGKLTGKHMNYKIIDSNGKEILYSHINAYGTSEQSIKIGDKEVTSSKPKSVSTGNNLASVNGYVTYTTVIDVSNGEVTLTMNSKTGTDVFEGKLPDGMSYDIKQLLFDSQHTNSDRTCLVDDISISKSKAASYTMKFVPTIGGEAVTAESITITDRLTGAVIAPETDGTYKLCDGVYSYTITAQSKTQSGELELSPATESKTVLIDMNTGAIGAPVIPG